MPNKIDYKTRIVFFYMLICKDVKVLNTYAGNTVSWKERKSLHKSDCNNVNSPKYNYKVYQIIRANGGFSNWSMIEIHKQLCVDKRDAERIEQSFITKNKCDMNTNNAHQTAEELEAYHQQYRLDNVKLMQKYQQHYRAYNREMI